MIESFVSPSLMALEIFAAAFVFGFLFEWRKHFIVRVSASVMICLEVTLAVNFIYYLIMGKFSSYDGAAAPGESLYKVIYYFIIFMTTVVGMRICYNGSIWLILFYSSGAYAVQHIAKNIAYLLRFAFPVFAEQYWLFCVVEVLLCALLNVAIYYLFVKDRQMQSSPKGLPQKVFLSLTVVLICIGLSRLTTDDADRGTVAFMAETAYAIVSCVLVLACLFNLSENDKYANEVVIMTELLQREREQYRLSRENIELINIKCHDLKHQIKALRSDASEEHIKEIEEAVMIYDSVIKTGNEVLDIILTEKSLLCEKNRIRLSCMGNGKDLSFMDKMDLYALFGNALSNAIERVKLIEDEERRCISLNIVGFGESVSVHIENFYDGDIVFEDALPVTSGDRARHGYGMKSMRYIAKKYDGNMTVTAKGGVFRLDFIFRRDR